MNSINSQFPCDGPTDKPYWAVAEVIHFYPVIKALTTKFQVVLSTTLMEINYGSPTRVVIFSSAITNLLTIKPQHANTQENK